MTYKFEKMVCNNSVQKQFHGMQEYFSERSIQLFLYLQIPYLWIGLLTKIYL